MFKPVDSSCDHIKLEHEILDQWEQNKTFDALRKKNAGKTPWSFLDGPITANNPMGVHHAWGRSLKDCYQRYFAMTGHELRYQNGFDCQGLWVEVEVEKEMNYACKADIERAGLEDFINRCKARVEKYSKVQTEQSIRLGYWMDWDNSYYTLADENNYTIWSFLKKCHNRKLIYKGLDAMPWCPRCETGISEQERREGYRHVEDTAVFVRFPLKGKPNEYLMIWTTTPWTLPANVSCAVHPELTYVKAKQGDDYYYVAESLQHVLKEKGPFTIEAKLPGKDMVGWVYDGPFDEFEAVKEAFAESGYVHRVIGWDEVSDADGVGIVHSAPGCGKEDFDLGKELKLPIIMPIDNAGVYHEGYGFLSGKYAGDVAEAVLENLKEKGLYYKKERYGHDYPHCWRCGTALLFRAVDEWYINMDWRDEIKDVVRQIRWIPGWGKEQELNWLENMGDWMISKKRFWGLALPIFECECGWFDVIGGKEELKERTVEGWEDFEGNSPHRPWVDRLRIECPQCGAKVKRIEDVGNPWLDAGIVPYSTTHYNTDRAYWEKWIPADLVLECFPGQFRNWFYALLSMSTMMENVPPFKTLLGHALVRDENGQEMHKSTGNAIWFDDAAEKMGADVMRWLYCRQNPTHNLNFGYHTGQQIQRRVLSTWWNVYSFFVNYARLDGFDANAPAVPYEQLQDIDRWLMSKLQELIRTAHEAMQNFDVAAMVIQAEEFIERLSNWYVRRNRRRFWRPKNSSDTDKLAAYQTLHRVLVDLCRILAPVVPFMTEQMYANLTSGDAAKSVHLADYPVFDEAAYDAELAREMDQVVDVVSRALNVRETRQIRVRQPLAKMTVVTGDEGQKALQRFGSHILDELNIKELHFAAELGEFVTYSLEGNMKVMGPKFGKDAGKIRGMLAKADAGAIAAAVQAGQTVTVGEFQLDGDDIVIEKHFDKALAVNDADEPAIILDIDITDELRREGYSRDVVRHIQQARKDADLEIQNHITVNWFSEDDDVCKTMAEFGEMVAAETLCDTLTAKTETPADAVTVKLGKGQLAFAIRKV